MTSFVVGSRLNIQNIVQTFSLSKYGGGWLAAAMVCVEGGRGAVEV